MKNIREIQFNKFRWIDIAPFSETESQYLGQNFNFNQQNIQDCLSPTQRPKAEKSTNYSFLILLFPVYNRQTRQIGASEVDFFIGQNYLITVHHNDLPPLIDLFNICQASETDKKNFLEKGPLNLLKHLLNQLYNYCFPILDHISLDINRVKQNIFSGKERQMVSEILIVRQNIADLRKTLQAHKNTIQKFCGKKNGEETSIVPKKLQTEFENLINLIKEIWDNLEAFREAIETLQQTNQSLISNRLSEIMKLLTFISVILLPITLTASIFGTNAINTPIIGQPYDFWVIIGIGMTIVILMIVFFKKKRWI